MSGYRLALKESIKFIKSVRSASGDCRRRCLCRCPPPPPLRAPPPANHAAPPPPPPPPPPCPPRAQHLTVSSDKLERDFLLASARTSMSSKIIGAHSEFFSTMVVDAMQSVRREGEDGKPKYPVSAVNVIKCHGRSSTESALVHGFALPLTRAAQQMPRAVKGARIAMLDFALQRHRMQLGVTVLVTDPAKLEAIRAREADITKERIAKVLAAGANVIMTTKGIDDLCMKYLIEAGVIGVRRVGKGDLKRLAAATGGSLVTSMADLEGGESFDAALLGAAEEVAEERVGDGEMLFVRGTKTSRSVSIVLRGANEFMLDEMDRALHDALCVVQRVLESKSLVAGGGAVEAALSIYLDNFATTLGTKEQLAIKEFAEALLVIPKTLAVNAAQDATDLVAKLCAFHHAAQASEEKADMRFMGLDLVAGKVSLLPLPLLLHARSPACLPAARGCDEQCKQFSISLLESGFAARYDDRLCLLPDA